MKKEWYSEEEEDDGKGRERKREREQQQQTPRDRFGLGKERQCRLCFFFVVVVRSLSPPFSFEQNEEKKSKFGKQRQVR